jgi:hypothetical protein
MSGIEGDWKQRFAAYRPTKAAFFWSCVACVVATLIVGFSWGGWVTGGTAREMAEDAATKAKVELAAAVCVERFQNGPQAAAQLATLKKADYWNRDDVLEKGGWLQIGGLKEPIDGAAELCAERLLETKLPATNAS